MPDAFRESLRDLFGSLPDSFPERHRAMLALRDAFHQEVGVAIENSFNQFAQSIPHDSFEEKTRAATAINSALRSLGLTIRDQGRPVLLVVDVREAGRPETSRFRLEFRDDAGRTRRTMCTRHALPRLSLMQDRPGDFWRARRGGPKDGLTR